MVGIVNPLGRRIQVTTPMLLVRSIHDPKYGYGSDAQACAQALDPQQRLRQYRASVVQRQNTRARQTSYSLPLAQYLEQPPSTDLGCSVPLDMADASRQMASSKHDTFVDRCSQCGFIRTIENLMLHNNACHHTWEGVEFFDLFWMENDVGIYNEIHSCTDWDSLPPTPNPLPLLDGDDDDAVATEVLLTPVEMDQVISDALLP
jgi:hypothetical protein